MPRNLDSDLTNAIGPQAPDTESAGSGFEFLAAHHLCRPDGFVVPLATFRRSNLSKIQQNGFGGVVHGSSIALAAAGRHTLVLRRRLLLRVVVAAAAIVAGGGLVLASSAPV